MGKVIYSMQASVDGYVEDASGDIGFAEPDEEVHREANAQVREASALLYGRRMYEVMDGFWPAAAGRDDLSEVAAEFAQVYVDTPRIVFSDTLAEVGENARLVRSADALAEVARLKQESDGPLAVGGPGLAATLLELIDEFCLYVMPVAVGGGKPFYPAEGEQLRLVLREQRAFASGTVYLRYARAG